MSGTSFSHQTGSGWQLRPVIAPSRSGRWTGQIRHNRSPGPVAAWPTETGVPGRDRTQLSPDGRLLAALRDPTTVALIDVQSGELRADLSIGAEVQALSFSADGQRIAVAHAGGIETWNVTEARKLVATTTEHAVRTIDFSPDGTLLAAGTEDRRVEIYGAESLVRQTAVPWQYNTPLWKVAFSPDGTHLAVMPSGDPAVVHLWDVQNWQLLWAVERPDKAGMDLAFSPDGGMLAVSEGNLQLPQDGAVTRIFDVAGGGRSRGDAGRWRSPFSRGVFERRQDARHGD